MSSGRPLARRLYPFLAMLVLLGLVALVSVSTGVPFVHLVGDANSVAGMPPYTGALTVVGLFLWCATATVCLFSAILLRDRDGTGRIVRFLSASGGLTGLLMLDDAFQIHEHSVIVGASEPIVFAFYAATAGVLFWSYRDLVRASEPLLLLLTGCLFALGIATDMLRDLDLLQKIPGPGGMEFALLLEDGFKQLGVVGWLNYYVWTCLGYLRDTPEATA